MIVAPCKCIRKVALVRWGGNRRCDGRSGKVEWMESDDQCMRIAVP